MIVLGINSVYHESAAAIAIDGKILAAVEEERFNRQKHAKPARVDNPHILPKEAIAFCLANAKIKAEDMDAIAFSFEPKLRELNFQFDSLSVPGNWGSEQGENKFRHCLQEVKNSLNRLLGDNASSKLVWVPHHLAHAASAFYPSGFSEAAILVIDGIAENASSMLAWGQGNKITQKYEIQYPHSLGFLWEKLAEYMGFSEYDACKVMGLAAYGQADPQREAFAQFAKVREKDFILDKELIRFRLPEFDKLESLLGKARKPKEPLEDRHKDTAASLQEFTDKAVMALVEHLYHICPSENLCLAGGVALNCVTNWLIKEKGPFANVFIPTAPHDAGTAYRLFFPLLCKADLV